MHYKLRITYYIFYNLLYLFYTHSSHKLSFLELCHTNLIYTIKYFKIQINYYYLFLFINKAKCIVYRVTYFILFLSLLHPTIENLHILKI